MIIMKFRSLIFFLILSIASNSLLFNSSANSEIYIKVGEAKVKKSLTALPAFQFLGNTKVHKDYQSIGIELYKTVYNDLDVTNYFQFINPNAFIEKPISIIMLPYPQDPQGFHYKNWAILNTDFLIRASYKIQQNDVILETYVYFIPKQKLILAKKYQGPKSNVRKIAHTFCDELIKNLTDKKSIFLNKIVVSSDRKGNRWKEIYIMDWDAHNIQAITNHNSITTSPSWSNDGKSIAYTAFVKYKESQKWNADLFVYDIPTAKRWLVSARLGIDSGSVWHPLEKDILFLTISKRGDPDIYKMHRNGKILDHLTGGPGNGMNVEPAISPDGKKMAFSSTRGGNPMIYIMDLKTKKIERLTKIGKYNASPSWSPDSKTIVFAGQDTSSGNFDLFTVDVSTKIISQRLTRAKKINGKYSNNEDPCWSSNGKHILFTSDRSGKKQIYIINPDGTNERRLTHDQYNYFKPKWSP